MVNQLGIKGIAPNLYRSFFLTKKISIILKTIDGNRDLTSVKVRIWGQKNNQRSDLELQASKVGRNHQNQAKSTFFRPLGSDISKLNRGLFF